MKDKTKVIPFEEQKISIYAYSLPQVSDHEGCIKVGETTREVEKRINEQLGTAGLTPNIHFTRIAQKSNGEWFHDKELHRYFVLNKIPKKDFGTGADEWFYFNGTPERAEELTDKFIALDYDEVQISENKSDYKLRKEQAEAVNKTLAYYQDENNTREFLWNAKPRFGKTLATYDFIRKISGRQFLIVTNRPTIANSWFDDFEKFISWQEPNMKFVSDAQSLAGKAITRAEYRSALAYQENQSYICIYFVSLQDLKGGKVFGGAYDKYKWISELNWDALIIDEAHEGVDTQKTDKAFSKINRKFTLHLSGTPFKAIANQKFYEEQIYNWSYLDEQKSKENWDVLLGSNPYKNLPTLNMFTYQMSKLIREKVELGYEFEESNVDYAFDLGEFFRVEKDSFVYEEDVRNFIDNLASNKFPFSVDEHRDELKHTLWLLDRVASAKALEKILRNHPVFKHYQVVIAAGDGKSFDEEVNSDSYNQEKSLDKVRRAIQKNERTITLSVGQLTTGVTIPEWTGVLMLNNIKSPALYFQAAFRAQNPYEYVNEEGKLMRKENAYVFDFAPERTLLIYDEFANNLIANSTTTTAEVRKSNIQELLNFFPVIAEDENGTLQELNAEDVLTIPMKIRSQEVVKRGFMSNLLFANISAIFSAPQILKDILEKIAPEKQGKLGKKTDVTVTNPMLDDEGNVNVSDEIVINESMKLFGTKIFKPITDLPIDILILDKAPESGAKEISNKIVEDLGEGLEELKTKFDLNVGQTKKVQETLKKRIESKLEEVISNKNETIKEAESDYLNKVKLATSEEEQNHAETTYKEQLSKLEESIKEEISEVIGESVLDTVEEQIVKVEEQKKKSTEDEVRDHLRGFTRTIPAFLMAYGNKETTLSNFEENIDTETFLDLTSITIEEFRKLRDGFDYTDEETGETKHIKGLFDEVVFNSSVQEFFKIKSKLVDYFNNESDDDIFNYIPPQKTNQIFTPRGVVSMMLDILEEKNPDIFKNKNTKFIDLYIKSGLYLTEIAKRLFKGLEKQIPFEEERIKHIFEKQLYGFAPSNIICNISTNFVFGEFDYIRKKNIVECDLVPVVEEGKLEEKIKEVWGEDMKFDVVIGNPPYQENVGNEGGNRAKAKSIYHLFIDEAIKMSKRYVEFITPSRWMTLSTEGIPATFVEKMMTSNNELTIVDYEDAKKIFPNVEIKGGVSYFVIDKEYCGECEYVYIDSNGTVTKMARFLQEKGLDFIIRKNIDAMIVSRIIEKVPDLTTKSSFSTIVSSKDFYTTKTSLTSSWNGFSKERTDDYDIKLYVNKANHGVEYGFIRLEDIQKNANFRFGHKVYIPAAGGTGNDNMILGKPFVGDEGSVCSQTYLVIGWNHEEHQLNQEKCDNIVKYIRTRFFRYMVSIKKKTQNGPRGVYQLVPLQNFTFNSDIDWTKSIEEIDEQLFEKYGISEEEREHIKNSIKEM